MKYKTIHNGSSLLEVLLYMAIFSILFLGFVQCAFALSATISHLIEKQQDVYASYLMAELIRYKVQSSDYILQPKINSTSTQLILVSNNVSSMIGSSTLSHLVSTLYPGVDNISFNLQNFFIYFAYSLHGRAYIIHIPLE